MNPGAAASKVAIAGQVGSGKSTVTRLISAETGWRRFSTGELFRAIAAQRGMTPLELNVFARSHPEIDDEVDGRLAALADEPGALVIDSRMAWHFVPAAFKVYLTVDAHVGAERIFFAARSDERYASIAEAAAQSSAREREEAERYLLLYGVDNENWRNYDLVVDTTHCPPDEVVARIMAELIPEPRPRAPQPRCLLSPRRMLPSSDGETATDIGVAVTGDTVIIASGHAAVGAAVDTSAPLVDARLDAVGSEPVAGYPSVADWAIAAVTAQRVTSWEQRHGFRFASLPPWVVRAG